MWLHRPHTRKLHLLWMNLWVETQLKLWIISWGSRKRIPTSSRRGLMMLDSSLWLYHLVGMHEGEPSLICKRNTSTYMQCRPCFAQASYFSSLSPWNCRAHGDLAQVSPSGLDAYMRDPSAKHCSCHSELTHLLIKAFLFAGHKMKSEK